VDAPIDCAIPPQRDCARYKMHKYWAGKPWYVVAEYIRHFTREGDIVLDPFCGGGVVGCEALINRRRTVLNDLNPMAVFIAKNTCRSPVDLELFLAELKKIEARIKDKIMDMYRLREKCPICGEYLYARHVVRGPAKNGAWIVDARCRNGHGRGFNVRRLLTEEEKSDISRIEDAAIPFWHPDGELPDGREIMRLKSAGITHIHQLFTRRNLVALSMVHHEIRQITDEAVRDLMLTAFSNTLLHASKLKSEDLRPMSANSYYCMGDWIEENVWERFENRILWRWGVLEGKRETNRLIGDYFKPVREFFGMEKEGTFLLLNRPAQDLSNLPPESVDYCFTDPPYGGSIQYGELTLLWRSWLGMDDSFIKDEIIINTFQNKDERAFENMLKKAFSEVYRVLKPGHWLSVTFNNRTPGVWSALLNACRAAGFEKVNVVPQKPLSKSFVQSWSRYSLKRDLILNFRKPAKTLIRRCENNSSAFEPKTIIILAAKEYLSKFRRATLPELFEAAMMKCIDAYYDDPDAMRHFLDAKGTKCFDMTSVDRFLQSDAAFLRSEENKNIIYSLVME
jgi:adenine-specific DNA methylase